ncbi:MAG TPA: hypothetical protein H9958_03480 [Candidatus Limosilactobacillus intestinavium]|nr:hypothetical protein [Candidatus Limosilactobacillus intestinavium]
MQGFLVIISVGTVIYIFCKNWNKILDFDKKINTFLSNHILIQALITSFFVAVFPDLAQGLSDFLMWLSSLLE